MIVFDRLHTRPRVRGLIRLVRCPVCHNHDVARRPGARVHARKAEAAVNAPAKPEAPEAIAGMPAELLAKLRELVKKTEDVGERFPEEARKMHYDETPKRAIRGEATREDADPLREEGIEFSSLPPFLSSDQH